MNRPRSLARRAGTLAASFAVLIGAAACSDGDRVPAAVTVDGVAISRTTVLDLVDANAAFYEQRIEDGLDSTGELAELLAGSQGEGEDTIGMRGAREAIESLVTYQVIRAELERRDAVPTQEDLDAIRAELEEAVGGAEELERIDADFLAFTVESQAIVRAYQQVLAGEADADAEPVDPAAREQQLRELYDQVAPTQPLCLNVILTATEAEADAALARVEGGEEFGAVAAEVSTEPTSAAEGGFAGCAAYDQAEGAFGVDLEGEPVGAVAGPVTYETGAPEPSFAVLQVESVDGPTYEQLLPQLEAQVPAEPPVTDPSQVDVAGPIADLLADAEISVDPRFGTWNDETALIDPPGTTPATTTSAPEGD